MTEASRRCKKSFMRTSPSKFHTLQVFALIFVWAFAIIAKAEQPEIKIDESIARPIHINEDDLWFTIPRKGENVKDALASVKINLNSEDQIFPPADTPLRAVDKIFFSPKREVEVKIGTDEPVTKTTYGITVRQFLDQAKIALSPIDKVNLDLGARLANGDKIVITRVNEETVIEESETDPPVKVNSDSSMFLGEEKVEEPGQPEIAKITVKIHSENGKETSREVLKKEITQEAKTKIVRRGTKVEVVSTEDGQASWYGTVAGTAAHKTLPFGTKLRVTNTLTGNSTIVKVADRGPYIAGRIVDLCTEAFKALAPLSTGTIPVKVEILK